MLLTLITRSWCLKHRMPRSLREIIQPVAKEGDKESSSPERLPLYEVYDRSSGSHCGDVSALERV